MSDILDMGYINSLPQPLFAHYLGIKWPVYDIAVDTTLLRIDVCGRLQAIEISDVRYFTDADGKEHNPDDFFADPESWVNRTEEDCTK